MAVAARRKGDHMVRVVPRAQHEVKGRSHRYPGPALLDPERPTQLLFLGYAAVNVVVFTVFLVVGPSEVYRQLRHFAVAMRSYPLAPLLILVGFGITSFPPLIGYSTLVTLCGFAYGAINGWLLATAGCLGASLVSFLWVARSASRRCARLTTSAGC